MRKRKRSDIAWQYCTVVDNNVGRVRCNFCGHVMWGGVTRLKHHLACIKGNVIPCKSCPPEVMAQIQEYLGQGSQKNEENIHGSSEQLNDMRGGGNEEQLQQEQEYWRTLMGHAQVFLNDCSQNNEENIDRGGEQVSDMRGGGDEVQLQPEPEHWLKFVSENEENLPHCSAKNKEIIDVRSDQANDMRVGGNEELLQTDQECWQKLSDEIHEYVNHGWQENEENIGKQVNDMGLEGSEQRLQLRQICWEQSVGDDMYRDLWGETSGHGWEAGNPESAVELALKNDEYARALKAAQQSVSELTLWEKRILSGEGCSGTKPEPSYQEYCMAGLCSDSDSE